MFSAPVYSINGYVALDYDTMSNTGTGEIYLYETFGKFTVGGKFITEIWQFNLKDGYFPAGAPGAQIYDLIIEYDLTPQITFKFTEGCKHYFSQSRIFYGDTEYIKIGVRYEF